MILLVDVFTPHIHPPSLAVPAGQPRALGARPGLSGGALHSCSHLHTENDASYWSRRPLVFNSCNCLFIYGQNILFNDFGEEEVEVDFNDNA